MSVTKKEAEDSHFFASETGHTYPNGVCSCGRVKPLRGEEAEDKAKPRLPDRGASKAQWDEWLKRGIF